MKSLNTNDIEQHRVRAQWVVDRYGSVGNEHEGVFVIASCVDGATLGIIASTGDGWDHVSVSRKNRTPNWAEMEQVKRMFFRDDEVAMQLHVRPSEHISRHDNCLHLWRPNDGRDIPLPPAEMV